jgi:hypothetical protein
MMMPLICWCGKRARWTRAEGLPASNACTKAHMLADEGHWYRKVENNA